MLWKWRKFKESGGLDALFERESWTEWLYDQGEDLFGYAGDWAGIGNVIPWTTAMHLYGLRHALAWIDVQEEVAA